MYSNSDKLDMILILGECRGNASAAERLYARRYPLRRHPTDKTFKSSENLRQYGQFVKPPERTRPITNEDNEVTVIEMLAENPHVSQRAISNDLHISKGSVFNIIKANKFHPYHVVTVQDLVPADYEKRVQFCQFLREQLNTNGDFLNIVLFCDEAKFSNNGMVNRHNCHYYAQENPRWIRTTHFQRIFSVNVWCGIVRDFVVGPHFFEGNLTGEMYLRFLQNILPLLLEDIPLNIRQTMWFLNDGAPAHYYHEVRNHLNAVFGDRWIGRGGHHAWPPRSPDLTVLDFFVWGKVKNDVYQTPIENEQILRERIIESCRSITPEMLARVRRNMRNRIELCLNQGGRHFEHLIR